MSIHLFGLILAVSLLFLSAVPKSFRRDVRCHFRALLCLIRRQHRDLREIGKLQKRGFQAIPVEQCHYCTSIVIRESVAKRYGAKEIA